MFPIKASCFLPFSTEFAAQIPGKEFVRIPRADHAARFLKDPLPAPSRACFKAADAISSKEILSAIDKTANPC